MAIMELKVKQVFFGQEVLNVFNFLFSGTPAAVTPSFGLIAAFGGIEEAGIYPTGTILDGMRAIQVDALEYVSIEARDVYSVTDFYATPFLAGTTGVSAATPQAPFLAYGLKSNRTRTDIRAGRKSICGVPDESVGEGGVIIGGAVAGLATLASRMSQVITYNDEGNTLSYAPIVVNKEKYTPNPAKPDKKAYKYWFPEAVQLTHIMESITWAGKPDVRSQVSRQYGRGR